MHSRAHEQRWAAALSLSVSLTVPAAAAAQAPAPRSAPEPLCVVSADAAYARSQDHPAEVGGGAMYAAARQRRFLDALRGPKGDAVRYTRKGALLPPDGLGPIDHYEVTYDGLATPITLFLDAYHYVEPKAPSGFVCARRMSLGLPPPDELRAVEDLDALAAEIARAPGFRAGPVDLGGEPPIGVLIDGFRMRSRRVRTGAATSATPAAPDIRTSVVAYPQTCGAGAVAPSAVALIGEGGVVVEAKALITDAAVVRATVPGQQVPAGSVVATFEPDALLARLQVRVSFADPGCASATRESTLVYTPARLLTSPMPARPADDTSGLAWVAVQAIVDHQGAFQAVRALGGPPALRQRAEEAVRSWTARPGMAGETPVAAAVTLQVTFEPAR